MAKQYSCFFITPIGAKGSEINQTANNVYQMIVTPAMNRCNVQVLRGDENASSNHIGMDVIQCIREADICLVDISYLNCNVYYELGLADAMNKPVILMKEASVDAATLPADVASRKYVTYSLQMEQLLNSWNDIVDFVNIYIRDLEAKQAASDGAPGAAPNVHELLEEIYTLRKQLEERPAGGMLPAMPMELRPGQALLPMQLAQEKELLARLEKLVGFKLRKDESRSGQILQILRSCREALGDTAYLKVLQKYCADHITIWQEYLRCAKEWLEVDLTYCALDITWVRSLMLGVEGGFMTEADYQDMEAICDRVLAISSEYREAIMLSETGMERYYDVDMANYYRGMLEYHMFQQTGQRKHLKEADYFWFRIRSYESSFKEKIRFSKELEKIETMLMLAECYRDCGIMNEAKAYVEKAYGEIEKTDQGHYKIKNMLEEAYQLSLILDEALAEKIAMQLKERCPNRVEEIIFFAQQKHDRHKAAALFREITRVIPVKEGTIQKFREVFSQKLHGLISAEKMTASSQEIIQFHQRTEKLMVCFKKGSEAQWFLHHQSDFLKKNLKDCQQREKTIDVVEQIRLEGYLTSEELADFYDAFPNARSDALEKARRQPVSVLRINEHIDRLMAVTIGYPTESEEVKVLKKIMNQLRSLRDAYLTIASFDDIWKKAEPPKPEASGETKED